jgi:hypothetical protein
MCQKCKNNVWKRLIVTASHVKVESWEVSIRNNNLHLVSFFNIVILCAFMIVIYWLLQRYMKFSDCCQML